MRRAALPLLVVAAAPAPAAGQELSVGDVRYRGVTAQGSEILFATESGERIGNIAVAWRPRCRNGTRFARQETTFVAPPSGGGATRIAGTGRYRVAERGGRIGLVSTVITGRRRGDFARPETLAWDGTLRARIVVRRHGALSDRCFVRTRWRARAEGIGAGAWEMTTQSVCCGEHAWRWDAANAVMQAVGTRDAVSVALRPRPHGSTWHASFAAPALNRLRAGQTYTLTGSVPGAATMSISAEARGCINEGTFTVERIAFDALRRLVDLRIAFAQTCDGDRETNRGVIDWRAAR